VLTVTIASLPIPKNAASSWSWGLPVVLVLPVPARGGFGLARDAGATFDIFYWL